MSVPHLLLFIGILLAAALLLAIPLLIGLRHYFSSGRSSRTGKNLHTSSSIRSVGEKKARLACINDLLRDAGFFYDAGRGIFSSLRDCWQRDMGYCHIFDEGAASFHMITDCEPIRFSYGGKEWLIEFWKGQYGITTGGEIGIYNLPVNTAPTRSSPFGLADYCYDSASDRELLPMSFRLYKNGHLLFRNQGTHWWLTGFVLGEFSRPEELVMEASLRFPTSEMCDAFTDSLLSAGYEETEFSVRRTTVRLRFASPHTPQPSSRGTFRESLIQKTNETNCALFQYFTRKQKSTLDKLIYLESLAPDLFEFCMNSLYGKGFFDLINPTAPGKPSSPADENPTGCPNCGLCSNPTCCSNCGLCSNPTCCLNCGLCCNPCCPSCCRKERSRT